MTAPARASARGRAMMAISAQAISVSGAATVDHTMRLEVDLAPDLRAKIDQAVNSQNFTVPLIGGGAGRMDSDAGSHRTGGIGHQ